MTKNTAGSTTWERERDKLKTMWVVAVLVFWFSIAFQGVLYYLNGTLNFVLTSIIGGMMIIGVVLKTRLQLHMRKKQN